jgi:hypothetical protein
MCLYECEMKGGYIQVNITSSVYMNGTEMFHEIINV